MEMKKRKPRVKSTITSTMQRDAIRSALPCPINKNARVTMTRSAVISACTRYNDARAGAHAGKRGSSICDTCPTGAAIREGKKRFSLPPGIKLYTLAELEQLKAAIRTPRREVCHG